MATSAEHREDVPPVDPEGERPDAAYSGIFSHIADLVAIALPLYVVGNFFRPLPPLQERAIFLVMILAIVFLRSLAQDGRNPLLKILDFGFLAATLASYGFVILNHQQMTAAPIANSTNVPLGILAIVVAIEATRRILSPLLAIIVVVVILYGLYGDILPREYGGHKGFSVNRIIVSTYLGTEGIFGIVTYTLFKFIFLFVLFGQLLQALGALEFVMTFSRALMGRIRGGPAMVSVVSSGLVGSISGSAVANVMVTGSVSIPLMKRIGFKPHMAGAMEAAASSGGQFLPPVMGAAAFLMAVVIGVPYIEIITAALIPALAYFFAMLVAVYVYARREGVGKEDPSELPRIRDAFKRLDGPIFIIGLGTLVYLLTQRYSATYAALASMLAMIIIGLPKRESRITPRMAADVCKKTSYSFVSIGVAGPSVGVVVAVFLLTGIATRFAAIIVGLTGENLPLLLVFTMLVSILLGVGLPTTVAYLILALTAAPALVLLGVDLLAAHMFIFFAGMMAMITPPVGLASFAAATIAKSDFWRTGVAAFMVGLPAYLVPYAFVYDVALLGRGSAGEIAIAAGSVFLGVTFMATAIIGRFSSPVTYIGRGLLFVAAVLLIAPESTTNVAGLIIGGSASIAGLLWARRRSTDQGGSGPLTGASVPATA